MPGELISPQKIRTGILKNKISPSSSSSPRVQKRSSPFATNKSQKRIKENIENQNVLTLQTPEKHQVDKKSDIDFTPSKLTFGEVYVCEFYKKLAPNELPPSSPRGDRIFQLRKSPRKKSKPQNFEPVLIPKALNMSPGRKI